MRPTRGILGVAHARHAGGGARHTGGAGPGTRGAGPGTVVGARACVQTLLESRAWEARKGPGCQRPGVWILLALHALTAPHPRTRPNTLREPELCGPVLQANAGTLAAEIG